jgi:hypothetical protein
MNNRFLHRFIPIPLTLAALLCMAVSTRAATLVWTNTAGGNWNVAANWSPNQVPDSTNDTAEVTAAGAYTITLNVNTILNTLTIGGAASGVQTVQGNGFTLAVSNATINAGGVLQLQSSSMTGAISVAGGGQLAVNYQTLDAQVTVEEGGELLLLGEGYSSSLGQNGYAGNTNCWLWVREGGEVNAEPSGYSDYLILYGMMTNQGSCDMTNSGFAIENNGTGSQSGGLVNLPGGVIDLNSGAGIFGAGGFDFLLNQGQIDVTNGSSTISVDNVTNQGTFDAQLWTLELQSANLNLDPSQSFGVTLGAPTDYGTLNVSGNAPLTGMFDVRLDHSYTPVVGTSFTVLNYESFSGGFVSLNIGNSAGIVWQPVYTSSNLTVIAQPAITLLASATDVAMNVNGAPSTQAVLLTSTNLALPLKDWTPVATNTFNDLRFLSFTNGIDPDIPCQFFVFKFE